MDKRRFQVFVSSTYEDLKEERQAAVEAILKAGHIPAGMELFTAGSVSQLEVIREWIKASDIFMLILGGRYGSVEPSSGLSYTEVEFDYARELQKPFFSVVISEAGREMKVKGPLGTKAMESTNGPKYNAFKDKVRERMCASFDSAKDVKIAVFETLPRLTSSEGLIGWMPANELLPNADLTNELTRALQENRTLSESVKALTDRLQAKAEATDSYEDLIGVLSEAEVTLPKPLFEQERTLSILRVAIAYADILAMGVRNSGDATPIETFLFSNIALRLMSYGLAQEGNVPANVAWQRIQLSSKGIEFLTRARLRLARQRRTRALTHMPTDNSPAPEISKSTTRMSRPVKTPGRRSASDMNADGKLKLPKTYS